VIFYLGSPDPRWIAWLDEVPLFLSARKLRKRRKLSKAITRWSLDSGGFSELTLHGEWTISPREYVEIVRRWREAGKLDWAAVQDWMCEPMVRKKTGLSVREHQQRTIQSYLDLSELAPDLPWAPVLQGWTEKQYRRHIEDYQKAGLDLSTMVTVGLGSVCRRNTVDRWLYRLIQDLHKEGVKLHAFGMRVRSLERLFPFLHSADSMAWQVWARKGRREKVCLLEREDGCTEDCRTCLDFARAWWESIVRRCTWEPTS